MIYAAIIYTVSPMSIIPADMLIYVKLGKGQKMHMIQYKNLNLHIIVPNGIKRHNLCIAFDKDIKAELSNLPRIK